MKKILVIAVLVAIVAIVVAKRRTHTDDRGPMIATSDTVDGTTAARSEEAGEAEEIDLTVAVDETSDDIARDVGEHATSTS